MRKRLWMFLMLMGICFSVVRAQEPIPDNRQLPYYYDELGLLNPNDAKRLNQELENISQTYECDVSIAVVNGFYGVDFQDYANDFYDYNGYGWGSEDDGILLMIDLDSKQWAVSTFNYGLEAFNDQGIDYIMDIVVDDLSANDFRAAFNQFAKQCEIFLKQARSGTAYFDGGITPQKPPKTLMDYLVMLGMSLGVGVLVAWIAMSIPKKQLKSVRPSYEASHYVGDLGLQLTSQNEIFLHRTVQRHRRPRSSSSGGSSSTGTRTTRTSSSGRTHGGRSGRF